MHRHFSATFLAVLAVALFALPAAAGDEEALREKVKQLSEKVDALQGQQSALVKAEIEDYLDQTASTSAQGDGMMSQITIHARFTTVMQSTLGLDPADRAVVNGDVDLDFDFEVTDNLDLFIHLTANTEDSSFPEQFGGIGGATFSGLTDGIGVNGTNPTDPGSITVYEAGIRHALAVGDSTLHWEIGSIDPRTRFSQNAFADDENTQFLNNLFDDSPSVLWASATSGSTVFGWHMWISFGDQKQFTLNWGWFNNPGQFFNNGQFYFQFHWKGEVSGREMNLRIFGFLDEMFEDGQGDGSAGGGVSWDWWVTEKIGVFVRITTNGGDVNPVELDASFGAQLNGLIGSRPDDAIGVAVGFITTNDTVITLPEDTEVTVELYYRYVMEDGKMHITPHVMYIMDPGGNGAGWQDDALFILGVRIHVYF